MRKEPEVVYDVLDKAAARTAFRRVWAQNCFAFVFSSETTLDSMVANERVLEALMPDCSEDGDSYADWEAFVRELPGYDGFLERLESRDARVLP